MSVTDPLPSALFCDGVPGAENEDSKRNFERPTTAPAVLLPRPEPRMMVPRFEPDDTGVAARLFTAAAAAASTRPGDWRGVEWAVAVAVVVAGLGWSSGVRDMIPTRRSLVNTRCRVVKDPKTTTRGGRCNTMRPNIWSTRRFSPVLDGPTPRHDALCSHRWGSPHGDFSIYWYSQSHLAGPPSLPTQQ
jgi:hypothetical protein